MSAAPHPLPTPEDDVLAEAWAKRLPEPTPGSFGVQHYTDWSDYPDWEDRYDWDVDDEPPIRFATEDDARAWLDAEEAVRFERAHAEWRKRKVKADAANELYRARKQCLIDNGLWKRDDEGISPLLGKAGPGWEPKRGWERRYRVVPDAEMDEPTSVTPPGPCACGHALGDHRPDGCRLCYGYCDTRTLPPAEHLGRCKGPRGANRCGCGAEQARVTPPAETGDPHA